MGGGRRGRGGEEGGRETTVKTVEGTQRLFSRVRATVDTKAASSFRFLLSPCACVRACVLSTVLLPVLSHRGGGGKGRKEGRNGNVAKAIPRRRGGRDMNYFGRIFSLSLSSSSSSFSSLSFFRREETIGDCVCVFFNF